MRLSAKAALDLLKQTASAWSEDYAPSMGAALSYYTLFSIAPLLLIVIAVAGLVFGAEAARGEIFGQLAGLIGADGAKAVEGMLQAADRPTQGTFATILGVVVLGEPLQWNQPAGTALLLAGIAVSQGRLRSRGPAAVAVGAGLSGVR